MGNATSSARYPLHQAVHRDEATALESLLATCNDVDAPHPVQGSALSLACELGRAGCAAILLDGGAAVDGSGSGSPPLCTACLHGHEDCVKALLAHGARLHQPDASGFCPLFMAAEYGHAGCVGLLLAYRANPEQSDADGVTPLYIACQEGWPKVARALLAAGAECNRPLPDAESEGRTPIFVACANGHEACVQVLLEHGVPAGQVSCRQHERPYSPACSSLRV